MENILEIIQKYSLTVRCLPHQVVNYWTYREGDEYKKYIDSNGNPIIRDLEVVIQNHDLEYFKNRPRSKFNTDTPEKQYAKWQTNYPNGKKLLKETRQVEKGEWWYVKETPNTDSIVSFDSKHDTFFAPTLEDAINLFLKSKSLA